MCKNRARIFGSVKPAKTSRFLRRDDLTMDFYGLIGEKLSHSLSPVIHKKIFELTGIEGAYKLFEIPQDKIGGYADALRLLQIRGVNVTIPYKQDVMEALDEISPEAQKIGAVNTIFNDSGFLRGYNTDYFGFRTMLLKNQIDVAGKTAAVLGTGGSAQAVFACLQDLKAKKIYAVTRDKRTYTQRHPGVELLDYTELEQVGGYLLINTTPVGMYPKTGLPPVPESVVSKFDCLADLIYNPKETEFLKLGRSLEKHCCGGLHMLVWQAVKAQEIWQGRSFGEEIFTEVYNSVNL